MITETYQRSFIQSLPVPLSHSHFHIFCVCSFSSHMKLFIRFEWNRWQCRSRWYHRCRRFQMHASEYVYKLWRAIFIFNSIANDNVRNLQSRFHEKYSLTLRHTHPLIDISFLLLPINPPHSPRACACAMCIKSNTTHCRQ